MSNWNISNTTAFQGTDENTEWKIHWDSPLPSSLLSTPCPLPSFDFDKLTFFWKKKQNISEQIPPAAVLLCNSNLPTTLSGYFLHPFMLGTYYIIWTCILLLTLSTLPLFWTVCNRTSLKHSCNVMKIISISEEAFWSTLIYMQYKYG